MDTYNKASQVIAKDMMLAYSTSFSYASRLFPKELRQSIYNIYGLVRIADEIVDTYMGPDRLNQLNNLEAETYRALQTGYSVNPIVHAFQLAANRYGIAKQLIGPFFASMRLDVNPDNYKSSQYSEYIHGSAEVIGLMCLKVFVDNDAARYAELEPGAKALGSAFQKINFLRDITADYQELHRYYFPIGSYEQFDAETMQSIITDIKRDFTAAQPAIDNLPKSSRPAVKLAYNYYHELLRDIELLTVEQLKNQRPRISNQRKIALLIQSRIRS